jgi:hypothetical protein
VKIISNPLNQIIKQQVIHKNERRRPMSDQTKTIKTIQNGGRREGQGRPKGSKNARRFADKRLAKLGMTPLTEILKLINDNAKMIAANDRENKPSAIHTAELIKHRGTLLKLLLPYQYSALKTDVETVSVKKPPMNIKLSLGKPKSNEEEE